MAAIRNRVVGISNADGAGLVVNRERLFYTGFKRHPWVGGGPGQVPTCSAVVTRRENRRWQDRWSRVPSLLILT